MNRTEEHLDRIRGCMIGGAVGDALGYPIEFDGIQSIRNRYGLQGLTRYVPNHNGVAEITDDTQMSLFTANGLLYGYTKNNRGNVCNFIAQAYCEWYETQTGKKKPKKICWIRDIPVLNH